MESVGWKEVFWERAGQRLLLDRGRFTIRGERRTQKSFFEQSLGSSESKEKTFQRGGEKSKSGGQEPGRAQAPSQMKPGSFGPSGGSVRGRGTLGVEHRCHVHVLLRPQGTVA